MKIISHSADADGRLSAYLVALYNKQHYPDIFNPENFIMTDYGKHDDIFSRIEKDEEVVICDFAFENGPDDMRKLLDITSNVTWIDHHESNIKAYGEFGEGITGLRIVGTAACMLTWIYYEYREDLPKTQEECEKLYMKAPLIVRLVHDNDVWRHDYKESKALKVALDAEDITDPTNPIWDSLMDNEYTYRFCSKGYYMLKFRDSIGNYACNSVGFECEINGKKGFALNTPFHGSPWFGDRIKNYDFICAFSFNGKTKEWSYSFYSDIETGANCYEIAKSINTLGGGHLHAAGCSSKEFIF